MLLKKLMFILVNTLACSGISYSQQKGPDSVKNELTTFYTFSGQENIGKAFTAFSAFDLKGKKYETALLKDKITFINLWFEACRPCMAEFAALNDLYDTYKGNKHFQFLSFTFETKENAARVVKEQGLKFPVLMVSYDSSNILNFRQGYPVSMIVNQEGKVNLLSPGGPVKTDEAQEKFNMLFKPALEVLLQKGN